MDKTSSILPIPNENLDIQNTAPKTPMEAEEGTEDPWELEKDLLLEGAHRTLDMEKIHDRLTERIKLVQEPFKSHVVDALSNPIEPSSQDLLERVYGNLTKLLVMGLPVGDKNWTSEVDFYLVIDPKNPELPYFTRLKYMQEGWEDITDEEKVTPEDFVINQYEIYSTLSHNCKECDVTDTISICYDLKRNVFSFKTVSSLVREKVHRHGHCEHCGVEYYRHRFCPSEIEQLADNSRGENVPGYMWVDNPIYHKEKSKYLVHTTPISTQEVAPKGEICTSLIDKDHRTLYRPYGFIILPEEITRRFYRDKASLRTKPENRRVVNSDVFEYKGTDSDEFLENAQNLFNGEIWNEVWVNGSVIRGVVIPNWESLKEAQTFFPHMPILILDGWKMVHPQVDNVNYYDIAADWNISS
ncbi:hypothetical protein COV24_02270 [candidate division WWE3 bacterium CG10_big_fil_rev_8_21_14_0_10_32_10]|uniref:Uncharacterized protein n=1 Tax=candidate division WWE3 bacterium CG10_big_fil_rev_8_21_14_0_10_32_10 TaxID=1975090 RepID=A0A2H0RAF8_UNCKA|nr:MAG: hypothetical protein COV24_02270 [candidate division WWE3 bacterium CG10_big_fil_rev_8_21_14_0_10_32_10]